MRLENINYLYVAIQLLLFMTFVLDIDVIQISNFATFSFIWISLVIVGILVILMAFLQLNTNLSPFPSPKSNAKLITTSMYKFMRYLIYTGILLITLGYGLYIESLYKVSISILLYILFYFKSTYEELRLEITFPAYELYKKSTGRLFPKISTK